MSEQLSTFWQDSVRKFKGNPLDFDFRNIVLKYLEEKRSDVFTHYLHPYPAKMLPYIPLYMFSIPDLCPPNGIVLDPFCGSGTVLLESLVHPIYRRDVYGVELNPLARLISKVKTTPLNPEELEKRIRRLFTLFKRCNSKDIHQPESKKINFWFSEKVARELCKLKFLIEQEEEDDYKDFFWICFSSVIRKVCKADPFIPPPVLLKPQKYIRSPKKHRFLLRLLKRVENQGVIGLFREAVNKNYNRLISLNSIEEITEGKKQASIIWDDARKIKKGKLGVKGIFTDSVAETLPTESVDFILTSPPYLTAQKYVRTVRLELLWLGFSENFLLKLQRGLIGTERVSLKEIGKSNRIGIERVDRLIQWASVSPHRAAEIVSYFRGMKQAFSEMYRVLKTGAYAVIVVGDNQVLGRNIGTHKLLVDIAISFGFNLEVILKDEIRGRGMITKRHNTGGLIKEEYIVVLRKDVQSN